MGNSIKFGVGGPENRLVKASLGIPYVSGGILPNPIPYRGVSIGSSNRGAPSISAVTTQTGVYPNESYTQVVTARHADGSIAFTSYGSCSTVFTLVDGGGASRADETVSNWYGAVPCGGGGTTVGHPGVQWYSFSGTCWWSGVPPATNNSWAAGQSSWSFNDLGYEALYAADASSGVGGINTYVMTSSGETLARETQNSVVVGGISHTQYVAGSNVWCGDGKVKMFDMSSLSTPEPVYVYSHDISFTVPEDCIYPETPQPPPYPGIPTRPGVAPYYILTFDRMANEYISYPLWIYEVSGGAALASDISPPPFIWENQRRVEFYATQEQYDSGTPEFVGTCTQTVVVPGVATWNGQTWVVTQNALCRVDFVDYYNTINPAGYVEVVNGWFGYYYDGEGALRLSGSMEGYPFVYSSNKTKLPDNPAQVAWDTLYLPLSTQWGNDWAEAQTVLLARKKAWLKKNSDTVIASLKAGTLPDQWDYYIKLLAPASSRSYRTIPLTSSYVDALVSTVGGVALVGDSRITTYSRTAQFSYTISERQENGSYADVTRSTTVVGYRVGTVTAHGVVVGSSSVLYTSTSTTYTNWHVPRGYSNPNGALEDRDYHQFLEDSSHYGEGLLWSGVVQEGDAGTSRYGSPSQQIGHAGLTPAYPHASSTLRGEASEFFLTYHKEVLHAYYTGDSYPSKQWAISSLLPNMSIGITLYGPVKDGVSLGMFGDGTGAQKTEVFGVAKLRYTYDTGAVSFVSWTDAQPGGSRIIDVTGDTGDAGGNTLALLSYRPLRWADTVEAAKILNQTRSDREKAILAAITG